MLHEPSRHLGAEVAPAAQDRPEGFDDVVLRLLLVDVAERACAQCAFGEQGVVIGADDEDLGRRRPLDDFLDQVQAVTVLQCEVDDHELGRRRVDEGERLVDSGRLAANPHVRLRGDSCPEPFPDERMIVDDQHWRASSHFRTFRPQRGRAGPFTTRPGRSGVSPPSAPSNSPPFLPRTAAAR